ncbi:GNAT family N-acetyltransferase [Streptomyces meridianus]|uniref:GNAT family N-acetyltransferase n=1 Tax=Streptomyces meridianus TaxID=2938945 RepID=A0ABT0X4F6_9ACTN|nr:GNAT family N-acetyltransferase [Streptomyces meridianus]MCM2577130.1 GNAT family N-acetyltransferase [Streptomyces meridianus]
MRIRPVRSEDIPALQQIERAAGQQFDEVGMPEIAADEPFSAAEFLPYLRAGLGWAVVDGRDVPVAYAVAEPVDGNLHVEQVSVHPDRARRGIGRALLDHVAEHAAASGMPALTLTSFADVPWNAPYYARCGFRVLGESAIGPGLRAVRRREADRGLDRWPRVCMRREV